MLLEGGQLDVAVGAPVAAVEGDEEGSLGEELRAADFLARGVAECEGGEGVADLDGGAGLVGCLKVGGDGFDGVEGGFGSYLLEVLVDGVELGGESHVDVWFSFFFFFRFDLRGWERIKVG